DRSEAAAPPAALAGRALWRVATKQDLFDSTAERSGADHGISVKSGDGVHGLVSAMAKFVGERASAPEDILVTRERHRLGIAACAAALDAAMDGDDLAPELV